MGVYAGNQHTGTTPTLVRGAPVAVGPGDGVTRTFNLLVTRAVSLQAFVGGAEQNQSEYSLSSGTGPGGTDQIIFNVGNEPPAGMSVNVTCFTN